MSGAFGVNKVSLRGGLSLLWKDSVEVTLISFSVGHINVVIKSQNREAFVFTSFYGNPNTNKRSHSWELFKRLKPEVNTT